MSNAARVKVVSRREGDFKKLLQEFKRAAIDENIVGEWRRRQYYESKSQKKRRKEKEATVRRLKESL